jgi:hypothetical protein
MSNNKYKIILGDFNDNISSECCKYLLSIQDNDKIEIFEDSHTKFCSNDITWFYYNN